MIFQLSNLILSSRFHLTDFLMKYDSVDHSFLFAYENSTFKKSSFFLKFYTTLSRQSRCEQQRGEVNDRDAQGSLIGMCLELWIGFYGFHHLVFILLFLMVSSLIFFFMSGHYVTSKLLQRLLFRKGTQMT